MTVRECYEIMGADYDGVLSRLRTDERVQKFLLKVLNDKSFELLCTSLKERNMEEAFRAAHTLKGICQNLSLDRLYMSSNEMAERLRGGQEYKEDIEPMLEKVEEDYMLTISCIRQLAQEA